MGIAPVQPDRPFVTRACDDFARTTLADQFVLCTYVAKGEVLPGSLDSRRIPVRAQIVVRPAGKVGSPQGPTSFGAQVNGGGGHGLSRGSAGTRGLRSCEAALARLTPGASQAGAAYGVVDPGDGFGGRVVRLSAGDRLIFPAAEIWPDDDGDACLTVGSVATDGTCWKVEGQL